MVYSVRTIFDRIVESTKELRSSASRISVPQRGVICQPGLGGRLHLESGRGDLDGTRADNKHTVRKYIGPYTFAAQADGGLVAGTDPPPQQLFELGGDESLPGYDYKEFAGDRAALFRTFASYRFGIWQRPQRFWRNYMIPGISPGIAASVFDAEARS